jgi:hypothetical protein
LQPLQQIFGIDRATVLPIGRLRRHTPA